MKPKLLDLFAGAQGAAVGYARAGFDVTASDIEDHKKHPEISEWITADALSILSDIAFCRRFQIIALSPPCQAHTLAQRIQQNYHVDLITPSRDRLADTGVPYVIENVPGAPLDGYVELCGCMFPELNVYRQRWFEPGNGVTLTAPPHQPHLQKTTKMGRAPVEGERMYVVGNFIGVEAGRKAMGIPWMVRNDLREAIPPVYTQYLGEQLITQVA